jgi:nucleoside-diphosphate-sugar epimerase
MRCVVTGAAGFIGSHLCEELLRRGHTVVGVDSFTPYYSPVLKAHNQQVVLAHPRYHFYALDLRCDDLTPIVDEADVIFHLAAMPGLPRSWTDFDGYWTCNVQGTQRLLESVRQSHDHLRRFILVSTSSVYGKVALGNETAQARPVSPYGVTKLAAEQLATAYAEGYGLPLVTLRYFSVYGPRQRPDMAYNRFFNAILNEQPIEVYGDGLQVRGNTYVGDCVDATIAAVDAPVGETYNVGGGETTTVLDVLKRMEEITGRKAELVFNAPRLGDQRQTFADTTKIRSHLGWQPKTKLDEGLARQWQWQSSTDVDWPQAPLDITPAPSAKRVAVLT